MNILFQPESKVGFEGVMEAGYFYLHVTPTERLELQSLMETLLSRWPDVTADLLLYVIMTTRDRQLAALVEQVAERRRGLFAVAQDLVATSFEGWSACPDQRPWTGPPLRMYDREIDIDEVLAGRNKAHK